MYSSQFLNRDLFMFRVGPGYGEPWGELFLPSSESKHEVKMGSELKPEIRAVYFPTEPTKP